MRFVSKNDPARTDSPFTVGLDFGTNSVRALVVDAKTGEEFGTAVWHYQHGDAGVILDPRDPNLARQHPADYLAGTEQAVRGALAEAARRGVTPDAVVGLGVDTTGSTPIPVNAEGLPVALLPGLGDNPAACAWLWKDHTGHAEAEEITELASRLQPEYLAKCGGRYSSEWFWSKILKCCRVAPDVFREIHTWVEFADFIPAVLTATAHPDRLKRGICAAGHKAMFHKSWGGYPSREFLNRLDPALGRIRDTLPSQAYSVADSAGGLCPQWAARLGLRGGIPVAIGAFDAHLGAVGSGIRPGTFVKIMGTSTCDLAISPLDQPLADIPGLCGIVPESVIPSYHGLEAGQSAVGDIFNWFVNGIRPAGEASHETLAREAEGLAPGASGLLALDWHNGNRTVLTDQRLTGLLVGMTLHTTPAEIYRALIEATAFGSRAIIERMREYGVPIGRVVVCGGISVKSQLVMQIYADILGMPIEISGSTQTCALGSAIAAAVVAGVQPDFDTASQRMTATRPERFLPEPGAVAVYDRLYALYRRLHDIFGTRDYAENQFGLMKDLLDIRDGARSR